MLNFLYTVHFIIKERKDFCSFFRSAQCRYFGVDLIYGLALCFICIVILVSLINQLINPDINISYQIWSGILEIAILEI